MLEPIAVTGATGHIGGRVVRHLAAAGAPVRAVVRDPERAPKAAGVEIAVATHEEEGALAAALAGVRTVLLVSAHEALHRLETHRSAVRACAAAGVERVVYTSFLGAAPQATFTHARDHAHTERAILDAGLRLTALRNSLYADFAPRLVGADGVIRGPASDGRVAVVARRDIARLATAVLLDDAHADRVYDVTGPEPLTLAEVAGLLREVTGRDITYHAESMDEARASRAGAEEWQIDGWVGTYAAIATGELAVTSHTVEHVTGEPPMSLGELLRAEPDTWSALSS